MPVYCPGCTQEMQPMRRVRRTWDEWDIEFYCAYCGREVRRDERELEADATEPGHKPRA